MGFSHLRVVAAAAVLLCAVPRGVQSAAEQKDTKVLAPSGEVYIAPTANPLETVTAPAPAPVAGVPSTQPQVDCLTEADAFYGSDFLSTKQVNTSTAAECCAACKLSNDCTVWNWCGKEEGCSLPANLAVASNRTIVPNKACIWKPRPVAYSGTQPVPPTTNTSTAMQGWTSGIPVNGTLLPNLPGFELTLGEELEYDEEVDFYCTGSSTSKPVCQLYGNAKGGALACLNNPVCRGFQICWPFPTPASSYAPTAVIRMKSGAEAPLNTSAALQNPYCSIYVLRAGAASSPNDGSSGYSLREAQNITAVSAAAQNLFGGRTGRKLQQTTAGSNLNGNGLPQSTQNPLIILGGTPPPVAARTAPARAPSPLPAVPARLTGTNFTTRFLAGTQLQAFSNKTFNFSQCYSYSPTIRVTIQSQQLPLQGPTTKYSIHTWTERPFRNSGDVCCAFQDSNDYFLDLETGVLAKSLPMFVATNVNLTTGPALRNYDTQPVSIVQSLVYIPDGQMNSPAGQGRQFTFPRVNGSDYVSGLEVLYYSLAQTALGNRFCTQGYPELAAAVNFVGSQLAEASEDGVLSPGGIPVDLDFVATASKASGAATDNSSCLVERGAVYQGDVLQTVKSGSGTVESCCQACWQFYDLRTEAQCDLWVLNTADGSCQLLNSTLATQFRAVPTQRDASASSYISGRRTAILPTNSTNYFLGKQS